GGAGCSRGDAGTAGDRVPADGRGGAGRRAARRPDRRRRARAQGALQLAFRAVPARRRGRGRAAARARSDRRPARALPAAPVVARAGAALPAIPTPHPPGEPGTSFAPNDAREREAIVLTSKNSRSPWGPARPGVPADRRGAATPRRAAAAPT